MFLACGYDFVWVDMILFGWRLKAWYRLAWCLRGELRRGGVVFYYYNIIIL